MFVNSLQVNSVRRRAKIALEAIEHMNLQYHPYAIYLFASALITLIASLIAWRRSASGFLPLSLLLLSMTIWSGSYAARWVDISAQAKFFWFNVMYIGIVSVPALFLIFALRFTRNENWLTLRNLILLSIQPAISLLLLCTNEYHHLYYLSIRQIEKDGLILLESVRGPWYFVNIAYSYIAIALGLALLMVGAFRSGPLFRNQYRLILLGSLLPWASSIYSEYNFEALNLDLVPIAFGLSGIIFAFSLLRTRLMDLIPVARSHLIENMSDGVLVLDSQNRVVDINSAMENFLGGEPSSLLGKNASEILSAWVEKADPLLSGLESQNEMRIPDDPSRYLDLRVTPLYDHDQRLNGRLIVFRDVTERKDVEKKLLNANYRLQSQLIEIGLLQSQLREQAIRDPLTNLFNRRYLEETLDRELARASREKYPVCIIMIDIDHFKQMNDTYGHEAGDLILKAMADVLGKQSRRGDFACRFGGEEFVVVMPNINTEMAHKRAETLRETLNSLHVPYGRYNLTRTFSMGIASYPANGDSRDVLLRAVDRAMYAAKEAGRDHIRSFDQIEVVK